MNTFCLIIFLVLFNVKSVKGEDEEDVDIDNLDEEKLWKPKKVPREEFFRCRGMPCDQWKRRQLKLMYLNRLFKRSNLTEFKDTDKGRPGIMSSRGVKNAEEEKGACVYLTEKQIDKVITNIQKKKGAQDYVNATSNLFYIHDSHREKRKLYNGVYGDALWELPIAWKFDGAHNEREKRIIRNAINEWEEETCLTFIEIDIDTEYSDNHLLFTRENDGCYAYMGRIPEMSPQVVNLGEDCFFAPGVAIHEVGHSVGLFHEHQRSDRDKYINVNLENLNVFQSQFGLYSTTNLALYDFGSVMHYSPKSFSFNNKPIIVPKNNLYLHTMGQRTGLSYSDAKTVNLSPLCKDECSGLSLPQKCQHGGYQNPHDCSTCKCPDGFSGNFCEDVASSKGAKCGGLYFLKDHLEIRSPGYPHSHYANNIECNWYIKSAPYSQIVLKFERKFQVFKFIPTDTCYHWVEVKYKGHLGYVGPRFCGSIPPKVILRSESNEMMITLRSKYHASSTINRRGFKAVLDIYPPVTTTVQPPKKVTATTYRRRKKRPRFRCRKSKKTGRRYCYRIRYRKKWRKTFKSEGLNVKKSEPNLPKYKCAGPPGRRYCFRHSRTSWTITNKRAKRRFRFRCKISKKTGKKYCYRVTYRKTMKKIGKSPTEKIKTTSKPLNTKFKSEGIKITSEKKKEPKLKSKGIKKQTTETVSKSKLPKYKCAGSPGKRYCFKHSRTWSKWKLKKVNINFKSPGLKMKNTSNTTRTIFKSKGIKIKTTLKPSKPIIKSEGIKIKSAGKISAPKFNSEGIKIKTTGTTLNPQLEPSSVKFKCAGPLGKRYCFIHRLSTKLVKILGQNSTSSHM